MGWQDRIRQRQELEVSIQKRQQNDRLNKLSADVEKDLPVLVDFVKEMDVLNSLIGIRNEIWGMGSVSLSIVDRQQAWQNENEGDTDLTSLLFKSKTYNPDFVVERATWEFANQGLRDVYPKNGLVVSANLVARWNIFVPAGHIDRSDYPGSSSWDDHLIPTCEFVRILTYFDEKQSNNLKVSLFSSANIYDIVGKPPKEISINTNGAEKSKTALEKVLLEDCISRKKGGYLIRNAPYLSHKLREEDSIIRAMRKNGFRPLINSAYYSKLAFG